MPITVNKYTNREDKKQEIFEKIDFNINALKEKYIKEPHFGVITFSGETVPDMIENSKMISNVFPGAGAVILALGVTALLEELNRSPKDDNQKELNEIMSEILNLSTIKEILPKFKK